MERPNCPNCKSKLITKCGFYKKDIQLFRCKDCNRRFSIFSKGNGLCKICGNKTDKLNNALYCKRCNTKSSYMAKYYKDNPEKYKNKIAHLRSMYQINKIKQSYLMKINPKELIEYVNNLEV